MVVVHFALHDSLTDICIQIGDLSNVNVRQTHNVVSVVAAPHHLWGHVLDGAAEGVGPMLSLMWRKLSAQT